MDSNGQGIAGQIFDASGKSTGDKFIIKHQPQISRTQTNETLIVPWQSPKD